MNREKVMESLLNGADESYKEFNKKLIPGVEKVIGVRMPQLKQLAKEIAKNRPEEFLEELAGGSEIFYEEHMLCGLVIGMLKVSEQERQERIRAFVPFIDNWAVCDCFCAGLKSVKKEQELYREFIWEYLKSNKEFELRFGAVMLMNYFIDDEHIDEVLIMLENIKHEGYYVKMAVAWALSVCYVKYPEKTKVRFERNDNPLDDFTFNKAIQKIRESYRVQPEDKEYLNKLKRKKGAR